jgi:hypothetical protein
MERPIVPSIDLRIPISRKHRVMNQTITPDSWYVGQRLRKTQQKRSGWKQGQSLQFLTNLDALGLGE